MWKQPWKMSSAARPSWFPTNCTSVSDFTKFIFTRTVEVITALENSVSTKLKRKRDNFRLRRQIYDLVAPSLGL